MRHIGYFSEDFHFKYFNDVCLLFYWIGIFYNRMIIKYALVVTKFLNSMT